MATVAADQFEWVLMSDGPNPKASLPMLATLEQILERRSSTDMMNFFLSIKTMFTGMFINSLGSVG